MNQSISMSVRYVPDNGPHLISSLPMIATFNCDRMTSDEGEPESKCVELRRYSPQAASDDVLIIRWAQIVSVAISLKNQ